MTYIFDSDHISKLINITENIYYKYKKILDVKYRDDNYYNLIGELTSLSKKEDEILLSLPKTTRLLDDVNNTIKNIYKCDNYLMYNFVLNRIDSNINNLCASIEDKDLAGLTDVYFVDSQQSINSIYDELYFNFILRLNNVINNFKSINEKRKIRFIQLAYIFSFKNLSDAFINNNLCLETDLIKKREDEIKDRDLYNSFLYLKNSTALNLCESLLMRIITLSNYFDENYDNVFYLSNSLLFKSLLQEVNDPDFMEIRNSFLLDFYNYKGDNFIINNIKRCFDLDYDRRFSLERNERVQSLDEKSSNNLIVLLKLEGTLYDKVTTLKLDGFDNFEVISSLLKYEKDLINELDVNENNSSVVSSVIFRDLSFFVDVYGDNNKKNAIMQRLRNIIDFFKKDDLADGILENNYESIICNHIVDSLKNYDGDLSVVKLYLYMYPSLTTDLVLLNGNYSMIDRFSDETTSISLGNENVYDYYYDKNEQLYKLFTFIFDDLTRYSDLYESEWSNLFDFKLCELSDIINSVSDEHLHQIKDEIVSLDNGVIKSKLLSLFKNKVY